MVQSFRAGRKEMAAIRFCPLVHHVKIKKVVCFCVTQNISRTDIKWRLGKVWLGVERVVFLSLNGIFTAKASGKNFA